MLQKVLNWTGTANFRLMMMVAEVITMIAIVANCFHQW
jgi:hypothetical protein